MKFFKKVGNTINSRAFTYISFVLSVCAAVFLRSATWTYGWIAELYPLGEKFVPTLFGMGQIKNIKNFTGFVFRAVSQNTFSAVFESYFFVIFQIAHLLKQKSFLRKPTLFHSA